VNKKSVLFDLDGTLLDTTEGVLESAVYAARQMGYPELPHETMLKFVGPPIQNSFRDFYGADVDTEQRAAEIFRDYYKNVALLKARLYPDMLDVLAELHAGGIKIGVATYKREDYAITLLHHFGIAEFCASMHGADNFNRLKKSDIVELCIRELGTSKSETVLVGDTDHDAKGAAHAGVDFIAVTYGFGYRTAADVKDYPYIGVADSPRRILESIGTHS